MLKLWWEALALGGRMGNSQAFWLLECRFEDKLMGVPMLWCLFTLLVGEWWRWGQRDSLDWEIWYVQFGESKTEWRISRSLSQQTEGPGEIKLRIYSAVGMKMHLSASLLLPVGFWKEAAWEHPEAFSSQAGSRGLNSALVKHRNLFFCSPVYIITLANTHRSLWLFWLGICLPKVRLRQLTLDRKVFK